MEKAKFTFKNDGIGFYGELLGTLTNTVMIFEPFKTTVKKGRKKDSICDKVGGLIDIPKYTSNFICVLEMYNSKVLSYLSLGYKRKNKLELILYSDFTLTNSKVPVYKKDNIGEYDIYECTDKIYSDCIHALILAKKKERTNS